MINQFGQFVPDYQYQPRQFPQRYEVIRVNGRGGAEAFQMSPNSDVLLLDTTAPVVWLKTTDGAGYPTCTPYNITPCRTEQNTNVDELVSRIEKLEAIVNDQSYSTNVKPAEQ